jgi:hypothetical protein
MKTLITLFLLFPLICFGQTSPQTVEQWNNKCKILAGYARAVAIVRDYDADIGNVRTELELHKSQNNIDLPYEQWTALNVWIDIIYNNYDFSPEYIYRRVLQSCTNLEKL